jgi:sterol desaturase/sphingolipid hydroxylase (fatty acid hydroxylase superfamily)
MSPAHHQIHHSRDPRHHGRNFGKFLAVWDRMLGTLYVPSREPEALAFGLGPGEDEAFESLWNCYVLPFRRAFARATAPRPAPSS